MTRWRSLGIPIYSKISGWFSESLAVRGLWFLLAGISFSTVVVRGLANDVWWDWRVGAWQVAHGRVMTRNVLTHHLFGAVWVNTEWFWADIVWWFAHWGGYAGLVVMSGLGVVAFYLLLWRFMASFGGGWMGYVLVGLVACGFSLGWWDFRPQVWAYPLAVGAVWWLSRFAAQFRELRSGAWFRVWWQVPLFLLMVLGWAQIHGSWILVLFWCLLEVLVANWSGRAFFAGLGVSSGLLVGLANPWGFRYVTHAFFTSTNGYVASFIGEWFSPNFHVLWMLALFAVYAFVGSMILFRGGGRRPGVRDWLYFVGFALAGLYGARFLPYLGIGMVFAVGRWPQGLRFRVPFAVGGVLGAVLWVVSLLVIPSGGIFAASVSSRWEPVASVNFLVRHHVRQVFGMDRWGGYLEARGLVPWIDGRADFWLARGQAFQRYALARYGIWDPASLVRMSGDRYAMVSKWSNFSWGLQAAGWRVVERSRLAVVLKK